MIVPIPLVGPSYANRELPLSAQVTKGLFPQIDLEARAIVSLHAFPGAKVFSTISGGGKDRGMHVRNGLLHAISNQTLYSINYAGTATSIGAIEGSGRCVLEDDGNQIIITTGGAAYVYTTTLAKISDPDLVNPFTVAYLNQQFVFDQVDQFKTSALSDGSSVDALDFAEAESRPDDILRVITYNQLVLMFGEGPRGTIEPWYNSGTGRPPFARVVGGVKPYGIAGRYAIAASDEFLYFLDDKRTPRRMLGLDIQPIGNPALGVEWDSYSRVDDVIGMAFTLDQQTFFCLTFPTANRTWCYHEQSGSWFQLSDGVDNARHRMSSYIHVYDKHLVADHSNGKIYELDFDTFTDNGNVIQRERTTAMIEGGLYQQPGKEIFFGEYVEFVVQTGEGLATGQGSDPKLMIKFTDDGGRTWSAETQHSLGVGGDYLRKVRLFQQGSTFGRLYNLKFTDPTKFTLISAHADVTFGI